MGGRAQNYESNLRALGGGVDFPKSFEKSDGLARREKFPEICSDRHDMGTSDPLKMVSDPLETT